MTNSAYIIAAYGICLGSLFFYWVHVHFEARNLQRKDSEREQKNKAGSDPGGEVAKRV